MGFLGSSLRNLIAPSATDYSLKLIESFKFAANKAQLSNQTTVFKYDFENDKYSLLILNREETGIIEEPILKPSKLPFYAQIQSARDVSGIKQTEGELKIYFRPGGQAMDVFLYIGSDSQIYKTIQIFRYGNNFKIHPGEFLPSELELTKITYGLDERDESGEKNEKKKP